MSQVKPGRTRPVEFGGAGPSARALLRLATTRDVAERSRLLRFYIQLAGRQTLDKVGARSRRRPPFVSRRVLDEDMAASRYYWLAFLVEEIFVERVYDVGDLGPNPVIVDCGANIGMATHYFLHRYPDARVIAFEPDRQAFDLLKRNAEANGWAADLFNLAVGDRDEEIEFFFDPSDAAHPRMSTLNGRMEGSSEKVQCVRLSTYLPERVDLLKLDVEGAERRVLAELAESGALERVERFAIEYHHHLDPSEDRLSETLQLFEDHGYGYLMSAKRGVREGLVPAAQDVMLYTYKKR